MFDLTQEALPEKCQQVAVDLLDQMDLDLEVAVATDDEGAVLLTFAGDDEGLLVGNKGQTLDALQHLIGKIVFRQTEDRVVISADCNGYRQRREQALAELAQQLHDEVRANGTTVLLNPMSSQDRRVIHLALKEAEGVVTRSEGQGAYRRLLIHPA